MKIAQNHRYSNWNDYIGAVWAELFICHSLDPNGSIVEVGPGFTDKIGLGLAACGFTGTLFIVEPNEAAAEWSLNRYRNLLIGANIVSFSESLSKVGERLPEKIEGVFMNHILDDMVLRASLSDEVRNRIFDGMKNQLNCAPDVVRTWNSLFDSPATLRKRGNLVIADICRLLEATAPRLFGISQYESWFLRSHALHQTNRFSAGILKQLANDIGGNCEKDKIILLDFGQQPEHWLFFDRTERAKGSE